MLQNFFSAQSKLACLPFTKVFTVKSNILCKDPELTKRVVVR
jgi:hypothetical protein